MPDQHTFVQVRLPAKNLVLGSATRSKGKAQALVEPVVRKSQDTAFRVWSLVKGFEAADLQRLVADIEERYSVTPRVSETESGQRVVYDVLPHHLHDSFWGALLAFQTTFGPPWLQFAGGDVTFRAQGVDCEPPECAARLERALALADTKATVEIVQVPDSELADLRRINEWRESELEGTMDSPTNGGSTGPSPQSRRTKPNPGW
jgi:hypothetical protein